MKKPIIGIQGEVNESEINELQKIYDDIDIRPYIELSHGIHGINEIVDLIFHDFSIIAFTRDLLLSTLITISYNKLKKCFDYFKKEEKEVRTIIIEYDIQVEDKSIRVRIACPADQIKELITQIDIHINYENLKKLKGKRAINITMIDSRIHIMTI